jgi:hypothetical protein
VSTKLNHTVLCVCVQRVDWIRGKFRRLPRLQRPHATGRTLERKEKKLPTNSGPNKLPSNTANSSTLTKTMTPVDAYFHLSLSLSLSPFPPPLSPPPPLSSSLSPPSLPLSLSLTQLSLSLSLSSFPLPPHHLPLLFARLEKKIADEDTISLPWQKK